MAAGNVQLASGSPQITEGYMWNRLAMELWEATFRNIDVIKEMQAEGKRQKRREAYARKKAQEKNMKMAAGAENEVQA